MLDFNLMGRGLEISGLDIKVESLTNFNRVV